MKNANAQIKPRESGTPKLRRWLGNLLLALVLLYTVYLCAVMLHRINTVVLKDTYRTIFHNELILCAVLLLAALDLRFAFFSWPRVKVLKMLGWALRLTVAAGALIILFFCGKVIAGSLIRTAGEAENAIVLGMALEKGQPTRDLLLRLDTAEQYLKQHPESTLILTGGNSGESGQTEAAVMQELLLARGIPEERLLLEDRAEDTRENFVNTAELIDPTAPVVLISSNYHMDRATRMAEESGFRQILRLPAPSSPLPYGANLMWEVILDINDWKNGLVAK